VVAQYVVFRGNFSGVDTHHMDRHKLALVVHEFDSYDPAFRLAANRIFVLCDLHAVYNAGQRVRKAKDDRLIAEYESECSDSPNSCVAFEAPSCGPLSHLRPAAVLLDLRRDQLRVHKHMGPLHIPPVRDDNNRLHSNSNN
jgi:hypothetical protein